MGSMDAVQHKPNFGNISHYETTNTLVFAFI